MGDIIPSRPLREKPLRIARPLALPSRVAALAPVLAAVLAAGLAACGGNVYPDRDPATVENVRVESARFLPLGTRYIPSDTAVGIRFGGLRTGYACSEILEAALASVPTGNPPAFMPSTSVRLPATPDCAVDTAGVDTVITRRFSPPPPVDAFYIRLANSSGKVTDSARLVRGTMGYDSLIGVPGTTGVISKGPWSFRDSSVIGPRQVRGDSLPSCRFLNQATWAKAKDTVKIRLSFVTLDSAAAPDTCRGAPRVDWLEPAIYVP